MIIEKDGSGVILSQDVELTVQIPYERLDKVYWDFRSKCSSYISLKDAIIEKPWILTDEITASTGVKPLGYKMNFMEDHVLVWIDVASGELDKEILLEVAMEVLPNLSIFDVAYSIKGMLGNDEADRAILKNMLRTYSPW